MQIGDLAFFYHSNTKIPGIVGLMKIVESNVVDPTQFDSNSKYYDPKSLPESPRWHTVKVEFVKSFSETITLTKLKQEFNGDDFLVVKKGNRLSVMPVSETVAQKILSWGEK